MRRSPIFTLTVVLTLALGIGANTAIFTVVNSVLLRPLPFHDPAHLVAIWDTYQPNFPKLGVSPTEYDEWARQTDLFEAHRPLSLYRGRAGSQPDRRRRAACACKQVARAPAYSACLASMRFLGELSSHRTTGPTRLLVLLSYRLWRDYFNADPQAHRRAHPIAGPCLHSWPACCPRFQAAPLGRPMAPGGQAGDEITNPLRHGFGVIARVKPGVSPRQARARLESISQRLAREHPKTSKDFGLHRSAACRKT